jgi:RNA 3'-terminal phosphate cyclase (ATP)
VLRLIQIDGARGEGGGQILRTALALSAATGQGFEMRQIRAGRLRPGLRPQHVAAVRATALACGARVGGVFDGSPDLRFEPGPLAPGVSLRDITAERGRRCRRYWPADASSRVDNNALGGGGQALASPAPWPCAPYPRGGGEIRADVSSWTRPASLVLEQRGALVAVHGVSGAAHLKGDVARRQRDAAQALLWERRRIEAGWEASEGVPSATPGSFLQLEAVFEKSRAAFGLLGERGVRAEIIGERAARLLLRFLDAEGAVDPHLADQLGVPLALARGGGRVTTSEVTRHLETVVEVLGLFGVRAQVLGVRGGHGGLEVERC